MATTFSVQSAWETALTYIVMYTERASFIDKIVNFVSSPFDKYINLDDRSDDYLRILGNGEDIGKLSQK